MLNLPGFLLHPLPNSWYKARAMSCLPTEGGDLLCLAPILPVRPLIASHVQRLVTAAPGAELSRCSVLFYCAASILHVLFWSTLTMVSISLLSLDLASRTEGCEAVAALPQQWAEDAGPGAHLGFPLAVEGVGSIWWTRWCCFENCSHSSLGVGIQVNPTCTRASPFLAVLWNGAA